MTDKIGNGYIPLRIGNLINTKVYGGPYRRAPSDMFGVKMAVEIEADHDVDIPTEDFNVPQVSDLRAGVVKALMAMITGRTVYAGCWGGIGRTGIFLAALAKVQIEYRKTKHRGGRGDDPVLYVRNHFIPHAVETDQQMQYIEDFDVADIVDWLNVTQVAMGLNIGYQPKQRPIDADCVSTEDGSCVADVECMHGPATYPNPVIEHSSENTGKITPIYDAHEEIPGDFLDGNVDLSHSNHRAQWKERWRERTSQAADDLEFDSGNPEDVTTRLLKLEERVINNETRQDQNILALSENIDARFSAVKELMELDLTKPTLFERIEEWLSNRPKMHW